MAQDIYRKSILEILKRESKQKKDPRNKKIKDSYEKINSFKDQILNLNNDLETKPKSEQKTIKDNIKSFNKEIKELDKQIKALYKELDTDYDLRGSFSFGKFANNYRNARNYSNYIPSDVAIKLGMRAWDAYEKVKFKKGAKQINKYPELMSFEAKSDSGFKVCNGILIVMASLKWELKVKVLKSQLFTKTMISNVKYSQMNLNSIVFYVVLKITNGTTTFK
jgi:hypothetical protein